MRHLSIVIFAAAALAACRLPNPDHCVHKDVDSDAWCAENTPARPHCSPCASEDHGCVATPPGPDDCPTYSPDAASDSSGGDSSSGGPGTSSTT